MNHVRIRGDPRIKENYYWTELRREVIRVFFCEKKLK